MASNGNHRSAATNGFEAGSPREMGRMCAQAVHPASLTGDIDDVFFGAGRHLQEYREEAENLRLYGASLTDTNPNGDLRGLAQRLKAFEREDATKRLKQRLLNDFLRQNPVFYNLMTVLTGFVDGKAERINGLITFLELTHNCLQDSRDGRALVASDAVLFFEALRDAVYSARASGQSVELAIDDAYQSVFEVPSGTPVARPIHSSDPTSLPIAEVVRVEDVGETTGSLGSLNLQ